MSDPDARRILTGNLYDKFNTRNPVSKRLVDGFKQSFRSFYLQTHAETVLEVGCGEGYMLEYMLQIKHIAACGLDIGMDVLQQAVNRIPEVKLSQADGQQLPYGHDRFDLIVCCEVLEHVSSPETVIEELGRVSRQYVIVSVPREPIWRMLNMLRGAFWSDFGNTPGHINHWNSQAFVEFLSGHFRILQVKHPLPWTMVLCEIS